ncbi:hypothetical protein SODALDRAFT_152259 [Sodiomyces alkalinus F11]|uniref:Uncharacterized protein n=1 Tax=Sodiomyces alkalinus (strain CBS 110278 / VKM F-3762 / F11) TaxID=1314773 RepID=A0A3N2PXA6_SODAK|nr:hypothetical protein SODALDRAFT_152259 [Sodiomyces alkalinus F11]ROT39104.1 hypothetical protein SODALDRAFT_152259 [Sodiomyces alkalinus F11]
MTRLLTFIQPYALRLVIGFFLFLLPTCWSWPHPSHLQRTSRISHHACPSTCTLWDSSHFSGLCLLASRESTLSQLPHGISNPCSLSSRSSSRNPEPPLFHPYRPQTAGRLPYHGAGVLPFQGPTPYPSQGPGPHVPFWGSSKSNRTTRIRGF